MTTDLDRGFSLVEVVLAALLSMITVGALLAFGASHLAIARTQPGTIDLQRRLRAGVEALSRDLSIAGAGLDRGPAVGPLSGYFASLLPRRLGLQHPDTPEVARADALTILFVPDTYTQSTMATPISEAGVTIASGPGCPAASPACGTRAGDGLLAFDKAGRFDAFTVTGVSGDTAALRSRNAGGNFTYATGSYVAGVETRTYYFDAASRQLRQYDDDGTDSPVVDDVTGFSVEYFGDPLPPRAPKPLLGEANCLYDAAGVVLPGLPTLAVTDGLLAALPLALFTDGPWCGAGATRYDADLLRIRRVRVTLRVSTPLGPGASQTYETTLDVAPRNLNLGWQGRSE